METETNMNELSDKPGRRRGGDGLKERGRWNPYLVGVGIGVLSWLAFGLVNQPLGISTALSAASSVCAMPVMGSDAVAQNAYWA
ncbi:MAG: hypothetical protein IT581_02875, partial [Verrucomicrobiales bacterium]|nr:hypothetical protein [Verrucomicrobiales bacterium]